jgi:hypothetical protein
MEASTKFEDKKRDRAEIAKQWAHYVEWLLLMGTLIGGFYLLDGKIERQGQRTDRLYEMFIDLLKQRNGS